VVFARQYFLDRGTEIPAHYEIQQLGEVRADAPLDAAEFRHLARSTGAFVRMATALAIERAEGARRTPNRFFEVPGHGVYGTPDAGYAACWYDLAPGESLAVELVPPRCRYWGVHLANRWGQSLDHRTRQTRLNSRTATAAEDGSVRVVIGPADPGVGNWLDCAEHAHGFVLFRWLLADHLVLPSCTVESRQASGFPRRPTDAADD
jgi:Protein of unknown function (DUF1214)